MISTIQWVSTTDTMVPNSPQRSLLCSDQKNMPPAKPIPSTSNIRTGGMDFLNAIALPAASEGRLRYSSRSSVATARNARIVQMSSGTCLTSSFIFHPKELIYTLNGDRYLAPHVKGDWSELHIYLAVVTKNVSQYHPRSIMTPGRKKKNTPVPKTPTTIFPVIIMAATATEYMRA